MPKVSINLVTWNSEKYIEDCLNSVLNQTMTDFAIIIIDNNSTDRTLEIINERFPHLKIIKHKDNLGFCKAHNQAIHWSKSDYVLCLNPDVVLEPNFLANAVEFLDRTPLCGALTGKLYRWQEGEKTKYIDSTGLNIAKNWRVTDKSAGIMDEGQFDNPEEVFGVSGACPVYRRKALEEILYQAEYFDEDFFAYKEDVDLSARLRWAGWQAWYLPSAMAFHVRTASAPRENLTRREVMEQRRKKSKFVNFYSYRNHLYFLIKNVPKFEFRIWFPIFAYELSKFLYVLFVETGNLSAFGLIIKNWQKLKLKRTLIMKNRKIEVTEFIKWLK